MLPANRKENSVVPDMSILENMYLAEHVLSKKKPCISKKQEEKKYQNFKDILNIKAADSADFITSLSGGNQQKVFLQGGLTQMRISCFWIILHRELTSEQKRKSTG